MSGCSTISGTTGMYRTTPSKQAAARAHWSLITSISTPGWVRTVRWLPCVTRNDSSPLPTQDLREQHAVEMAPTCLPCPVGLMVELSSHSVKRGHSRGASSRPLRSGPPRAPSIARAGAAAGPSADGVGPLAGVVASRGNADTHARAEWLLPGRYAGSPSRRAWPSWTPTLCNWIRVGRLRAGERITIGEDNLLRYLA